MISFDSAPCATWAAQTSFHFRMSPLHPSFSTKLAQATQSAMVDTGEKVEYKLQGTILRVKKANGDVSSVVAGKSVVLKSVTEDGNERGVL